MSDGKALTTVTAMAMKVKSAAAETAVADSAILRPTAVRVRPLVGSAGVAPHETHRHGADRRSAHQRQDHTARTFHVAIPGC